jgi:diguanylate cyclase (GGDEF)-like protein
LRLREYFAARHDPYAGGDLDNARRLAVFLWLLGTALTIALLPFSPPTEVIGDAGWVLAGLLVAIALWIAFVLYRGRLRSWGSLLIPSYASVLGVCTMQWLAGGVDAPYELLILLPVVYIAATQPPRKIAPFLLFIGIALAAPYVYDHGDAEAVGADAAMFIIWCGLSIAVNVLMTGVRAQRLALSRDEAMAREEARIDPLTGLHNRRAFNELLEAEVMRARRAQMPLSVGMVDIHNFKEINERWSYAEGDRCLQDVADTMRSSLRDPDVLFRWGGDEFAVVLTGAPTEGAEAVGERLSKKVDASCRRPDGEPISLRFASAELDGDMQIHELVAEAGRALTATKTRERRQRRAG